MVGSTTISTRFHKAAQDGNLDILREATKRDCNAKDEDGMTPTLWAAFQGNLEALRLLVGRGGDPEKANYHFGQTALHVAAGRGHMNCVTFLVGFEANLWALDHDLHTPMDLAALAGRKEIIEYLDKACTKQELVNKKKVELKKDKAIKDAEKHRKKYEERMKKEREREKKQIKKVEKEYLGHKINDETPIPTINGSKKTGLYHQEPQNQTFTQLVGGTIQRKPQLGVSTGVKKIIDRKLKSGGSHGKSTNGEYKQSDSNGMIKSKDSQIIYVNSYETQNGGKRGKISDVFDTRELLQSKSQSDILALSHQQEHYEYGSIFDRPGFGSVAFRQNVNATLNGIPVSKSSPEEDSSIGSAGSLVKRNTPSHLSWENEDIRVSDEENSQLDTKWLAMKRFLVVAGVDEYTSQFLAQRIDLEALLILSDEDFKELGIPMGPRKKLMRALDERRRDLANPGDFVDSKL
uniref:Usher syndrome type-1G protein homolog n=1 Tax=Cacopsylla melanoneura TaxID=428564 RepID=A0A8D8YX61_9HEMI